MEPRLNVDPTRPATGAGRPDRFPSLHRIKRLYYDRK